jgi:hypothetical protein
MTCEARWLYALGMSSGSIIPWIPSHEAIQQGVSALRTCKFLDGNKWANDVDPNRGPIENTAFRPLHHVSKELEGMPITSHEKSYRLVHRPPIVNCTCWQSHDRWLCLPNEGLSRGPKAPVEMQRIASVHDASLSTALG